jgi:hypothetical protein
MPAADAVRGKQACAPATALTNLRQRTTTSRRAVARRYSSCWRTYRRPVQAPSGVPSETVRGNYPRRSVTAGRCGYLCGRGRLGAVASASERVRRDRSERCQGDSASARSVLARGDRSERCHRDLASARSALGRGDRSDRFGRRLSRLRAGPPQRAFGARRATLTDGATASCHLSRSGCLVPGGSRRVSRAVTR